MITRIGVTIDQNRSSRSVNFCCKKLNVRWAATECVGTDIFSFSLKSDVSPDDGVNRFMSRGTFSKHRPNVKKILEKCLRKVLRMWSLQVFLHRSLFL